MHAHAEVWRTCDVGSENNAIKKCCVSEVCITACSAARGAKTANGLPQRVVYDVCVCVCVCVLKAPRTYSVTPGSSVHRRDREPTRARERCAPSSGNWEEQRHAQLMYRSRPRRTNRKWRGEIAIGEQQRACSKQQVSNAPVRYCLSRASTAVMRPGTPGIDPAVLR